MLIKSRKSSDIPENDVTSETVYASRRQFIKAGLALGAAATLPMLGTDSAQAATKAGKLLLGIKKSSYGTNLTTTPYEHASTYNNFYEFGTAKSDPARYAHTLITDPWNVAVEGECAKPRTFGVEDLIKTMSLEERVYRLRCVEAWSMVIPWVGFKLGDLLKLVEPTSKAKYVEFVTLHDVKQMPGQARSVLQWPYVEGLRLDEAMHPLTLLAVGMYGKVLPNQNGAPIRLVVPWKYGFKNIKSIVKIRLVEKQPNTSWNIAIPSEYGFYANVNPEVDHPRWTQKRERIIGTFRRRKTDMLNGYADEVGSLYRGMDLRKFF